MDVEKKKVITETEFKTESQSGKADKSVRSWTPEDLNRVNQETTSTTRNLEHDKTQLASLRAELGSNIQGTNDAPGIERSQEFVDALTAKQEAIKSSLEEGPEIIKHKPLPKDWEGIQLLVEQNGFDNTLAAYEDYRKRRANDLLEIGEIKKETFRYSEEWKHVLENANAVKGDLDEIDGLITKLRENQDGQRVETFLRGLQEQSPSYLNLDKRKAGVSAKSQQERDRFVGRPIREQEEDKEDDLQARLDECKQTLAKSYEALAALNDKNDPDGSKRKELGEAVLRDRIEVFDAQSRMEFYRDWVNRQVQERKRAEEEKAAVAQSRESKESQEREEVSERQEQNSGDSDATANTPSEFAAKQAQILSADTEQAMEHNETSADMVAARTAAIEAINKSGLEDGFRAYLRILSERDQQGYIPLAGTESLRGIYRTVQELESAIESPQASIIDLRKAVKNLMQAVRESLDSIPRNRSSSRDDPDSLSASGRYIGQLRESIKELTSRLYAFDTNDEIKEIRTSFSNLEDLLDKQEDYARRLYQAMDNYRSGPRY